MPPLRGQHTVLCHPRWLPTSGLTEFAVCWGGAEFEPRTTALQSGATAMQSGANYTKFLLYKPLGIMFYFNCITNRDILNFR
jgi:hypothetical protein